MPRTSFPEVPSAIPQRGWTIGRAIGRLILKIARWGFAGEIPNISKGVIIVAPHTSNWDFVIGAAGMLALDLELRFIGKHTLFGGPLAPLMRGLGGIPVNRHQPGEGFVEGMAERFESEEKLILALAPEGTRSTVSRWKTGFHRIALAAGVPIFAVALDYGPRRIRFGPLLRPTDDLDRDLAVFLEFFATARGRRGNSGADTP
jgi:1-acyl-sn-glycerol-3-phosphate acyltransferase